MPGDHVTWYPLLGCRPAKLLEIMKKRFISLGGIVFEGKCLSSICIYNDAAVSQPFHMHFNCNNIFLIHLYLDMYYLKQYC